jgi:hypothetical protein
MADKDKIELFFTSPEITPEDLKKSDKEFVDNLGSPLIKTIVNSLNSTEKITRLAFEEDPNNNARFAGLYYEKVNLIPDRIIKRLRVVDDLLATIIRIRGNQVSAFGTALLDRLSTGFRIDPINPAQVAKMEPKEREDLAERIRKVTAGLLTCGDSHRWDDKDKQSFQTFLYLQACNAVSFGRFATEFIYVGEGNLKKFHSFRTTDPGVIYKVLPKTSVAENVRHQALDLLERLNNKKLVRERFEKDEFAYVQVVEGRPIQAFTSEEMVVHTVYPVTDIELNGYPVTPIDTAIAAITTHINITSWNKLYFQNGRAAKGMVVIQADHIDPSTLNDLKQQFVANINSVSNAHRIPIFKVNVGDNVSWQSIESTSKDMDFQYLLDSNYRVIFASFNMSPDEVPGFNHLSKGTNTQSLSESNSEFKLEAARDVGIRPLMSSIENFINDRLLPLFDDVVTKYCRFKFYGLDAESPEKELTNIERRQELHDTINETLRSVDKEPIPKEWCGDLIMNPRFGQFLDQYHTVGQIREHFFGIKDASKDPRWDYCRDQFWMQQQQFLQQKQQMDQQTQMAQQQAQQMQAQAQSQQPQQGQEQPKAPEQGQPQAPEGGGDFVSGIDQALAQLSKAEKIDLRKEKKKLWVQHEEIVKSVLDSWEQESKEMLAEVALLVDNNKKE